MVETMTPPATTSATDGTICKPGRSVREQGKIGLDGAKGYDSLSEDKLDASIVHVPGTGFPWQDGANTYIAGHRLGYLGTGSWLVFYRLNELGKGDQITLKDSNGKEYAYRVTEQIVVGPEDVQVTNPVPLKRLTHLVVDLHSAVLL